MYWCEPFFNLDFITDHSGNLKIDLHKLKFHSTVFKPNDYWDKNSWTTYFNLIPIGQEIHMYYRANLPINRTSYHHEHTCMVISHDGGFTFQKPKLQIIASPDKNSASREPSRKIKKSKINTNNNLLDSINEHKNNNIATYNNIIWKDDAITHNFYAFNNQHNTLSHEEKVYAIGSLIASSCRCCGKGSYLLSSRDGINFEKKHIIFNQSNSFKQGYPTCYDTLNHVTYDSLRNEYRAFLRYNYVRGKRCIQTCTSGDLNKFNKSQLLKFKGRKRGYYYLPSVQNLKDTGYFLGFPSGQSGDQRSSQKIDLIFSRDGVHFEILKHNILGEGSVSPQRFVSQILTTPDGQKNMYFINNAKDTQVDLYLTRKNGLSSIATMDSKIESSFTTVPIYLTNNSFILNAKTNDAGSYIRIKFYLARVDTNQRLIKLEKLLKDEKFNKIDDINRIIKLPNEVKNEFVSITFTMKNSRIFTYGFHTTKEKMLKTIETYQKVNAGDFLSIDCKSIDAPEKTVSRKSRNIIKQQDPEPLDLSHVKLINQKLTRIKLRNKDLPDYIYFQYIDFLKPKSEEDIRKYEFKSPITKIDDFKYTNHNVSGGGCPTYGRVCTFTAYHPDKTKTDVTLIKNSKSNCKVLFVDKYK